MPYGRLSEGGLVNAMVIVELCSALLLICAYIAIGIYIKREKKSKTNLHGMLLAISLVLVTDAIATMFRGVEGTSVYYLLVLSNFLYFICTNIAAWLVVRYSFEVIENAHGVVAKVWRYFNNVVVTVSLVSLLINLFFPFLYFIDENNLYQRKEYFLISQVPAVLMVGLLILINIQYSKFVTSNERLTILSYVVFPFIAELVQVLNYGFSWLPLSMAFSAFLILTQYVLAQMQENGSIKGKAVYQEGKALQTRIILFVCVIITVFFGLIAKIAIDFASKQMNKEIEAHYQMLANKTTEQASAWIVRETQILLNQKASLEIINNFDHDYLTTYLANVVENYNYDNYIYDIYFVDTENVMSAGSGYIQEEGIDFRLRSWYEGALSADNMCYTVPYVDVDTGKYVVTVSIKVFDQSRKFVGVLALDIFVDKLLSITEQQDLPDNSYLFIVDNDLGMVTHPSDKFDFVDDKPQSLLDASLANYEKLAKFLKAENDRKQYITYKDYDGIKRSFFMSVVEDCDWYIVAAISKDVMDESRKTLSESIFVALIVCLVLGIILTLWATNNIIRKLTEAQVEANAANEAKSRFLANMSHEIRTPINAVLGMDEILLNECKDENIKEYALNIQAAGQALLGVVNDILDFSKIESDKLDIVPGIYVLGDLIGSCMNLIQLRVDAKELRFEVKRDEYLPKTLYGDEIRVRQIISNLLTNAVKYTERGTVTLSVCWESVDDTHGQLCISVKDTGIGIKKENLDDLFTSFQRLDEKKNRNIEGTGLGLTITKQLVELMGGEIVVNSEYGKGSEFVARIPQQIVNGENTESFDMVLDGMQADESSSLHVKDARILVVDDVDMNLQVVKGLLKNTGILIDTVSRGMDAISSIKKNSYDLIFLDHMMPELDGVETLKIMKRDYADLLGDTPVIMLTANAILGVEEEYQKEGFSGYLSKPVNRDSIYGCLKSFLKSEKIVDVVEDSSVKVESYNDEETNGSALEQLKMAQIGFDMEQALNYCGGMEDMLIEMLKEYVVSTASKNMRESFEKEDIDNYRIGAHSMKGTSAMVGFSELSEQAKALEMAAKDKDWNFIKEHHAEVINKHQQICQKIEELLS